MNAPLHPEPPRRRSFFGRDAWILLRYRGAQFSHLVDEHLRSSPMRTFLVLVLLAFVWTALHQLFVVVFQQIQNWQLVAVVASQQIFMHFFLVLAIMLSFSNAILTFGSLFGKSEPEFLLALPASARQIVFVKWIEGVALSSWSFLLLGVPLMLAVAKTSNVAWYYYPLFVGHFTGFVIIPSTLGLLAAWAVAMWAPRRPIFMALWVGGGILIAAIAWLARLSAAEASAEEWMNRLFMQTQITRNPFFPSAWTAQGIVAAIERRWDTSLFYLGVVLANAAFLVWVSVNLVGRGWAEAYSRAREHGGRAFAARGYVSRIAANALFFYLPASLRQLMVKDLRMFIRDAAQWTQMVIMFGLLVLYATNLRDLPLDLSHPRIKGLLSFLNLTTVSLILATFTSRFVFPMLSIESQQLWSLGMLPMPRTRLLWGKFIFSLVLTLLSAGFVMWIATDRLALPGGWAWLQLMVAVFVCIGLCAIAVGLGARFPVLHQRNPARIAAGFGGTVNLVASMLYVSLMMLIMAYLTYQESNDPTPLRELSLRTWSIAALLGLLTLAVGGATMHIGTRHFRRLEV